MSHRGDGSVQFHYVGDRLPSGLSYVVSQPAGAAAHAKQTTIIGLRGTTTNTQVDQDDLNRRFAPVIPISSSSLVGTPNAQGDGHTTADEYGLQEHVFQQSAFAGMWGDTIDTQLDSQISGIAENLKTNQQAAQDQRLTQHKERLSTPTSNIEVGDVEAHHFKREDAASQSQFPSPPSALFPGQASSEPVGGRTAEEMMGTLLSFINGLSDTVKKNSDETRQSISEIKGEVRNVHARLDNLDANLNHRFLAAEDRHKRLDSELANINRMFAALRSQTVQHATQLQNLQTESPHTTKGVPNMEDIQKMLDETITRRLGEGQHPSNLGDIQKIIDSTITKRLQQDPQQGKPPQTRQQTKPLKQQTQSKKRATNLWAKQGWRCCQSCLSRKCACSHWL